MSNSEILKRTNCRLCGYLCGMTAHMANGRLSAVEPDPTRYPDDPSIVKGCRRFLSSLEILDHPQRCNYPQKRIGERGGGEWQQVSWEEALDEIAARLRALRDRYGPETLASSIGGARAQYWPLHRFLDLFGSPNNVGIGQICWNLAIWINSITYGSPLENELVPGTTAAAVLWGFNPAESDNSLFWRNIIRFKQAGGQLVVVDPRRTRTAAQADLWLGLQPATDGALALGLLNVILAEAMFDQDMVARWCSGFDELQARAAHFDPARVEEITVLTGRTWSAQRASTRPANRRRCSAVAASTKWDAIARRHCEYWPHCAP